jgi:hypothetical protein
MAKIYSLFSQLFVLKLSLFTFKQRQVFQLEMNSIHISFPQILFCYFPLTRIENAIRTLCVFGDEFAVESDRSSVAFVVKSNAIALPTSST